MIIGSKELDACVLVAERVKTFTTKSTLVSKGLDSFFGYKMRTYRITKTN